MSNVRVRTLVRQRMAQKQNILSGMPALLGDGSGNVTVPGMANMVYVRMADQPVMRIKNTRIPALNDLPIYIGYDPVQPNILQVLQARDIPRYNEGQSGYPMASPHHLIHEWMAQGGGTDVVWMQLRQFMPLRITLMGGMTISVYRGMIWTGTAWTVIEPIQTIYDLTTYKPSAATNAAWVLVSIGSNGAIILTKGAEVTDVASLTLADIPAIPAGSIYTLGAIRVYGTQTAINEARTTTDIVDLRFPMWSSLGSPPSAHATTHETGGSDAIAIDTLAAATDNTALNASASAHGLLPKLANDATKILNGLGAWVTAFADWANIANKPSTYPPSAHATTHETGGSDAIAIDTLAAATDNTNLNASASAHGLLPKLANDATKILNGLGAWVTAPIAGHVIRGISGPAPQRANLSFSGSVVSVLDDSSSTTLVVISATPIDGWVPDLTSWVYASPTTMTYTGDDISTNGHYGVGTKIKLINNGTVKKIYGVSCVYSGGVNTLTVLGDSSAPLAPGSISGVFYNYGNPVDFPGWFNAATTCNTSTIDNGTSGQQPAIIHCAFTINGRIAKNIIQFASTNVAKNGLGPYVEFNHFGPPINTTLTSAYMAVGTGWFAVIDQPATVRIGAAQTVVQIYAGSAIADNSSLILSSANYSYPI
jgi:hypothetical protein